MSDSIPVLFARSDSIYKSMDGFDVWDLERDAMNYHGPSPVIAHPPCGLWGRLRRFSKAPESERECALHALAVVRVHGGVLEHPAYSTLWREGLMPAPGKGYDQWGGWTLPINQYCFGHPTEKKTWLYIVGVAPRSIPALPLDLSYPSACIRPAKGCNRLRIVSKPDREHTPIPLAFWLRELVQTVAVLVTPPLCLTGETLQHAG